MPSFDGGDDFIWIGGPGEGLWFVVGLVEEAVDGDLEVDNGAEDAAFQAPRRELREEALDGIVLFGAQVRRRSARYLFEIP